MTTRTIDQLSEFFNTSKAHHQPVVGAEDPELGPYSKWLSVPDADVEKYCAEGYRKLTRRELDIASDDPDTAFGEVEDYTEGWKHSE